MYVYEINVKRAETCLIIVIQDSTEEQSAIKCSDIIIVDMMFNVMIAFGVCTSS